MRELCVEKDGFMHEERCEREKLRQRKIKRTVFCATLAMGAQRARSIKQKPFPCPRASVVNGEEETGSV